ncbi:transferase [Sphingomonas sp. UYP23]
MSDQTLIRDYIAGVGTSRLAAFADLAPWEITTRSHDVVAVLLDDLDTGYRISDNVAVHKSASIEPGVVLKGPAVIGPSCFIASGAYVRDGCWLGERCILGPGAELKSSFLFPDTKLAHFNFVGDSVLGAGVNLESGSVIANFRNERDNPAIVILLNGTRIRTGVDKFGALVGDSVRIGANAVVAPGALLKPGTTVPRLGLVDMGSHITAI